MTDWIVGYGSLIWRPAFDAEEAVPGVLDGWVRRFWQGSPDHRGMPDDPGRVVTVLPEPGARVAVMAYRLPPDAHAIRAALDHREQAGYRGERAEIRLDDGRTVQAGFYAAGPGNPSWLGPAPLDAMAAQIARCVGPSGTNLEYLLELDAALVRMGAPDPHVRELVAALPVKPGPA